VTNTLCSLLALVVLSLAVAGCVEKAPALVNGSPEQKDVATIVQQDLLLCELDDEERSINRDWAEKHGAEVAFASDTQLDGYIRGKSIVICRRSGGDVVDDVARFGHALDDDEPVVYFINQSHTYLPENRIAETAEAADTIILVDGRTIRRKYEADNLLKSKTYAKWEVRRVLVFDRKSQRISARNSFSSETPGLLIEGAFDTHIDPNEIASWLGSLEEIKADESVKNRMVLPNDDKIRTLKKRNGLVVTRFKTRNGPLYVAGPECDISKALRDAEPIARNKARWGEASETIDMENKVRVQIPGGDPSLIEEALADYDHLQKR
jgi:hypothetical protein